MSEPKLKPCPVGKALDATPTILDMTLIDAERSET